jgi:hypothetical protein
VGGTRPAVSSAGMGTSGWKPVAYPAAAGRTSAPVVKSKLIIVQ